MQDLALRAQRGQAYTETVIFLPIFLFALFGLMWFMQSAVVNERLQSAVRYSGMISDTINPYMQFSLFSLYNNLGTTNAVQSQPCQPPPPATLNNSGPYPGPTSAPFWTANPSTVTSNCSSGALILSGNGLSKPELFLQDFSTMSAQTTVPGYIQAALGSKAVTLQAQQNFITGPDMSTLMHCYPELNAAITASLRPTGIVPDQPPQPLPDSLPANPLTLDRTCGAGN